MHKLMRENTEFAQRLLAGVLARPAKKAKVSNDM